jgi:hypothetical protein
MLLECLVIIAIWYIVHHVVKLIIDDPLKRRRGAG